MQRWKKVILGFLLAVAMVTTVATVAGLILRSWDDSELFIRLVLGMAYLVGMGFAAMVGLERPVVRWLSLAGLAMTALMMVALPTALVLGEFYSLPFGSYGWGYTIPDGVGFGLVLTGFLCLVSLALAPRLRWQGRIMQMVTVVAISGAEVLMIMSISADWAWYQEFGKALAVAIVLSGGGLIGVWTLARWLSVKVVDPLSTLEQKLWIRCPRCGCQQELATGESHCIACALWFRIEMEEPKCTRCNYNLRGLTGDKCPECGTPIAPATPIAEPMIGVHSSGPP